MADTEGAPNEPEADPLIEALIAVLMEHAAPAGAVDFPRAAAAFGQLLAEMIGPQPYGVQRQILKDFSENLNRLVLVESLKATARAGRTEQPQ